MPTGRDGGDGALGGGELCNHSDVGVTSRDTIREGDGHMIQFRTDDPEAALDAVLLHQGVFKASYEDYPTSTT